MVSIPTSLFGVISFITLAAILIGYIDSSDQSSGIAAMNTQIQKDAQTIKTASDANSNTTVPVDWYASISNTGSIIQYSFHIIISYILYPFLLFANLLVSIGILPTDLTIVSVFIGIGVVSAIAIFLRRG